MVRGITKFDRMNKTGYITDAIGFKNELGKQFKIIFQPNCDMMKAKKR